MATLRKITLNWEIRTGAITCDTGYIKRQELCDVDLYVTVDGTAYALDTSWALNLSIKPTLLGDNAALVAVTTWTASATTGLYQATAQTIGGTALDTYLAANNADTTDDEGNKLVDLDVYYTVSMAMKAKSDTVTVICKPDVGRTDDTVPATIVARNDFLVSNGTGLLVNVAAGYAANGAFVAAQSSVAITNATNYIEITAAGVASVNTTAFTAGSYPLATVVASAGAITSNTDLRAWITPKPAPSTVSDGDKGDITVSNSGATWTIDNDTVTLAKLAHMPTARVVGRTTAGTGTPELLTISGTGSVAMTTSPTLFEPSSIIYKILNNQDGTMKGRLTNDFTHVYLDSGGDIFLRTSDFVSSYLHVAHFSASTGRMSLGHPAFLSGKIGFKNATSTGTTTLDSANASANDYTATLQAATGTLALVSGNLGTPSAIVLTNATGTAASLTAGNVTTNANLTGHVTSVGNAAVLGSFTMAQLSTAVSDGDPAYVGAANTFSTGQTISSTTSILLGTAGSAVGNVGFRNATSGTTTLAPATGALGTGTVTLPLSGTLAISSAAQTFTGTQTFGAIDATSIGATTRGTILGTTGGFNSTLTAAGAVTLTAGTASTSTTTGTVVVTGGIGVSGAIFTGDDITLVGSTGAVKTMSFSNVGGGIYPATGGAARISNPGGDCFWQFAGGKALQSAAYHEIVLQGGRSAATVPAFVTGNSSTYNTRIQDTAAASISLSIEGAGSKSGNYINCTASGGGAGGIFAVSSAGNVTAAGTLAVTGASTLTGNLTSNGALISTPQALSGAGAVNVTTLITRYTSTGGAEALTLADGTMGQIKTIIHEVDGGSGVLTPTTKTGFTTITFTNAGDACTLVFFTTRGWMIQSLYGAVAA